jgi:hypothetical protein
MSIFQDSGIILKIDKKQKDFLYTIFSQRFWKVIAQKHIANKEKMLDLWFVINYEIKTKKSDISKIRNIKIINELKTENKNFEIIYKYLDLLNTILKKTAFWVENNEIFEIINQINKYKNKDLEIKIILAKLKIIDLLWELNINHKDQTIYKNLLFIHKNNFGKIIKLKWINEEIKDILLQISQF